jgi:hypothetical protein
LFTENQDGRFKKCLKRGHIVFANYPKRALALDTCKK